jgi:hypothetical protein
LTAILLTLRFGRLEDFAVSAAPTLFFTATSAAVSFSFLLGTVARQFARLRL